MQTLTNRNTSNFFGRHVVNYTKVLDDSDPMTAWGYLIALNLAEVLTTFVEPMLGLFAHSILLIILFIHASMRHHHPFRRLLLVLTIAPLIRILSFTLPFGAFSAVNGYLVTAIPLGIAAFWIMYTLKLSKRAIGFNWHNLHWQVLIGLTGIIIGGIEYYILKPQPIVETSNWFSVILAVLILFMATGFVEEFIFRGLLQRVAVDTLGNSGIVFVALLFTFFHIGYKSLAILALIFAVALYFGIVVSQTRSILGVILAHGTTNITLFLVLPAIFITTLPNIPIQPEIPIIPIEITFTPEPIMPTITTTIIPHDTVVIPVSTTDELTESIVTPEPTSTPIILHEIVLPTIEVPLSPLNPPIHKPTYTPTPTIEPIELLPTATTVICELSPPTKWVQYIVQKSDTLFGLAMKTNTTVERIMQVNCLVNINIKIGMTLYLPAIPATPTDVPTLATTSTPIATPTIYPTATHNSPVSPTITPHVPDDMATPTSTPPR
ncbi:MAG: hypothetical protein B6242_09680 [Anaerolineaceae bacterium 4572_78]|nr:MAG: hypothetical protein B6242_09680 [Anaerolineaceae bacterium 4572_78]